MDIECHVGKMACVGSTCYPIPRDALRERVASGELAPCPVAPAGGVQPWMRWAAIAAVGLGAAAGLFLLIRRL